MTLSQYVRTILRRAWLNLDKVWAGAVVTANSLFISNPGGAAFRKIASYEASTGVATSASTIVAASQKPNEIPTAKPVPGRPGFVYNPFDPTATRLLDVRGKPSGTKLRDPVSGKLFIAP